MLRISKAILVSLVGLWGLIGGIQNLAHIDAGYRSVEAVVNPAENMALPAWQVIEAPAIVWLAWVIIPLGKFTAAALCLPGAWRMWRARSFEAAAFNESKALALVGCSVAIMMLFGGFVVAAETYFQFWQTQLGALALPIAFRYIGCIALIAIFVQQQDL